MTARTTHKVYCATDPTDYMEVGYYKPPSPYAVGNMAFITINEKEYSTAVNLTREQVIDLMAALHDLINTRL